MSKEIDSREGLGDLEGCEERCGVEEKGPRRLEYTPGMLNHQF